MLGKRVLLLGLIFFTSLRASAQMQLPPQFLSLDEQVSYLLFLQEQVPALFEQGAEYDVNFLAFIQAQNNLVTALRSHSSYMAEAEKKPALREIKVAMEENQTPQVTLEFRRDALVAALGAYPALDFHQQKSEIYNVLKILESANLRGFLTGLLSLYSDSRKSQGFRLKTNREKIDFLAANPLPDNLLQSRFKAEKYGLNGRPLNWTEALKVAENWQGAEMTLARSLYEICQSANHGTNEDCLDTFRVDEETWETLEPLLAPFASITDAVALAETVLTSMSEQFGNKVTTSRTGLVPSLRLSEVPPALGTFRGLAGGDCSTSYSFPYVYMPQERTYFVYSDANELLGYLSGTVVKVSSTSEPFFYIHSISGQKFSKRDVLLAVHALHSAATDLGVKDVILPTVGVIDRNINYVSIQQTLHSLVDQNSILQPVYLDDRYRKLLSEIKLHSAITIDSKYDRPEGNKNAHPVLWDEQILQRLKVEVDTIKPSFAEPRGAIQRNDALMIALDLLTSERLNSARVHLQVTVAGIRANNLTTNSISYEFRVQVATQILARFNIDFAALKADLNQALNNPARLPLEAYYQELRTKFSQYGVTLDDELIRKRPYLFYEGHLAAPDALTSGNKEYTKRTLDYVITMIRRWPYPEMAYQVVHQDTALFENTERFHSFILSLFNGSTQDYGKLIRLHQIGYRFTRFIPEEILSVLARKLAERGVEHDENELIRSLADFVRTEAKGVVKKADCEAALNTKPKK